jgi:hypothetical protein
MTQETLSPELTYMDRLEIQKQSIIADEGKFQGVCEKMVREHVIHRANTLISEIGPLAEHLDDYDTYISLTGGIPDYTNAVYHYIVDGDLGWDDLEMIADQVGYFSDALAEIGAPDGVEEDWLEANPEKIKDLRKTVYNLIDADEFEQVGLDASLDPDYDEIYEFWIVSDWLAAKLREQGEVVVDYLGFTIYGRGCTGQSIYLDGNIRRIMKDLDADWFYWSME